jgi:plasmid stabilization system protein ParE
LKVTLSDDALLDRREVQAWYRGASREVAARFRTDLRAALEFIGRYPLGAPVLRGLTRGKTMKRFPFSILYEILPDRILVIAIADERRDPEHYAKRLD